jgi:hypothetical protein
MIYLECYGDEALVKALGVKSRDVKHAFSKGEVCNMLGKVTKSIGIVDEDPNSGKPLYEKRMLDRIVFKNPFLILCLDTDSHNKLVIIRPRLEKFIIQLAKDSDTHSDQIPSDTKRLYEYLTMRRNTQKFEFFKNFISEILRKNETMRRLEDFLK